MKTIATESEVTERIVKLADGFFCSFRYYEGVLTAIKISSNSTIEMTRNEFAVNLTENLTQDMLIESLKNLIEEIKAVE